jgi:hypothetical protein
MLKTHFKPGADIHPLFAPGFNNKENFIRQQT